MPRDLFGDVTDPSITLGTRKWYTVPVSLAVHVMVISALVIVPLMATGSLPLLSSTSPAWMPAELPELPAPPPRPRPPDERPRINPNAAPVNEPTTILQPLLEAGFENTITIDPITAAGAVDGAAVVEPPPPVQTVTEKPERTVHVGGTIRAPARVSYVAPMYPPIALSARLQGLVIIEATIDTGGRVQNARVMRTDSALFTDAALSAVRQWTYTPTLLNGVPVSVIMTVTVQFRLQ